MDEFVIDGFACLPTDISDADNESRGKGEASETVPVLDAAGRRKDSGRFKKLVGGATKVEILQQE